MLCDRAQRSCHWEACHLWTLARGLPLEPAAVLIRIWLHRFASQWWRHGHHVWTLHGALRTWEFIRFQSTVSFIGCFAEKKAPSESVLGFFWTWLFNLMVGNVERRRWHTALSDALKALTNSLPCHLPTLKQNILRLSWYESQGGRGITTSGS